MGNSWIKSAMSEQEQIKAKEKIAYACEEALYEFAKRVNAAAGKDTVTVGRVYSSGANEVPFSSLSVVNNRDTIDAQTSGFLWTSEEKRTAVYKVNFGLIHNSTLKQLFGAAATEAGIGVRKGYVKICPGGSHTSITEGRLQPTSLDEVTSQGIVAKVMEDIYNTLPESVRSRVDLKGLEGGVINQPSAPPVIAV